MSTYEELTNQKAELLDRLFDRAGSDLAFRRQLIENPGEALRQAGFADEIQKLSAEDDVSGYSLAAGPPHLTPLVDPPVKFQPGLVGSVMLGVESLFSWATAMVAEAGAASRPSSGKPPAMDYVPNREAM